MRVVTQPLDPSIDSYTEFEATHVASVRLRHDVKIVADHINTSTVLPLCIHILPPRGVQITDVLRNLLYVFCSGMTWIGQHDLLSCTASNDRLSLLAPVGSGSEAVEPLTVPL